MSDSYATHRLWPARLLCAWDSPGKNTGVGSPFPSPGDLPKLEMEPSSALQVDSFTTESPGKVSRYLESLGKFSIPFSNKRNLTKMKSLKTLLQILKVVEHLLMGLQSVLIFCLLRENGNKNTTGSPYTISKL